MTKQFQLPEKEYFSIEEIAERWGCDVARINHYIHDMRILRPVITSKDITKPTQFIYAQLVGATLKGDLTQDDLIALPKFLYVNPFLFYQHGNYPDTRDHKTTTCQEDCELYETFSSFVDFEGKEYYLVEINRFLSPDKRAIETIIFDARVRDFYITKEERDRFESEYGSTTGTKLSSEIASELKEHLQTEKNKLENEVVRLRAENAELKKSSPANKPETTSHPCKNSTRDEYAPELALALELWEELYLKEDKPNLPHTTASTNWLNNKKHQLSVNATKRISAISNPASNKNTGKFKEKS